MRTHSDTNENEGAMYLPHGNTSEVAILDRVLEPDMPSFSPETAHAILALDFKQADRDRMRQLLAKGREGTLTADEQVEINNYERVGHLINILHSKARRSLRASSGSNADPGSH